ncbi:hypothetical protein FALCPG4_007306 [Fusarium falciforme]
MWTPKGSRGGDRAVFNFTDSTGRFSAFLMRLDGMPGKAKGYARMTYHLDVKVTDSGVSRLPKTSLTELVRTRSTANPILTKPPHPKTSQSWYTSRTSARNQRSSSSPTRGTCSKTAS